MNPCTSQDIQNLGTILGVWAHPDDETWGCAGVMAQAARQGQRVACVTATKGEAGKTADEKHWPAAQLGRIRAQELEAALRILGITEHYWLDYPDSKMSSQDKDKAVTEIANIISKVNPDTIFTFGRDGLTGHEDHKTICAWTCAAAEQAHSKASIYGVCEVEEKYEQVGKECSERFAIYFKTKRPTTVLARDADLLLQLSPELMELKLKAFKAQPSQTAQFFRRADDTEMITRLLASECFMRIPVEKSSAHL